MPDFPNKDTHSDRFYTNQSIQNGFLQRSFGKNWHIALIDMLRRIRAWQKKNAELTKILKFKRHIITIIILKY